MYGIIKDMTGENANPFFKICWRYLTPLVSLVSYFQCYMHKINAPYPHVHLIMSVQVTLFLFPQGSFIYSLVEYEPLTYNRWYVYPAWAYVLGWMLALSSILLVPGWALYKLGTGTGNISQVRQL